MSVIDRGAATAIFKFGHIHFEAFRYKMITASKYDSGTVLVRCKFAFFIDLSLPGCIDACEAGWNGTAKRERLRSVMPGLRHDTNIQAFRPDDVMNDYRFVADRQ